MEQSFLFDIIDISLLGKWRDKIEAENRLWLDEVCEFEKIIAATFSEADRKTISSYATTIRDRLDYVHYCIEVKLVNFCLKMGMQIEKFFSVEKDSFEQL